MIDILLVDDHPAMRAGTKVMLEQGGDMKVFDVYPPSEVKKLTATHSFDVMLIDLQMPECNGVELSKQILEDDPDATILIYSEDDIQHHFNLLMESGIAGFVPKAADREQMVTAIRCALRGEVVLPYSLVKHLRRPNRLALNTRGQKPTLTELEIRILKKISSGKSNKEIANALLKSQRSLEYMLTDLFHKLKVKSRIEAFVEAKRLGLLDESEIPLQIR